MSRFISCCAAMLAVTWHCADAARGEFVPRVFSVPQTFIAPSIDGLVNDPVWRDAQQIDDFYAYQSGGTPAAAVTSARFLWDNNNLYALFQMTDADIRSSCGLRGQCGNDARLFDGDVAELFLKTRTGRTPYFEFEWSPRNELFDARFGNERDPRWNTTPGVTWDSTNIVSAVALIGSVDTATDSDMSWSVEVAIPFANLVATDVQPGDQWYFTVARYDFFNRPGISTPALMMSTPGDPEAPNGGVTFGFHTYELYDLIEFSHAACDLNADNHCGLEDLNSLQSLDLFDNSLAVIPGNNEQYDLTGDGTISLADRNAWLTLAATQNGFREPFLPGDANLDGDVDELDFAAWNATRFTESFRWDQADFTGDGGVDASDFVLWNAHRGLSARGLAVAIPEPSSLLLFSYCLFGFCLRCTVAERSEAH